MSSQPTGNVMTSPFDTVQKYIVGTHGQDVMNKPQLQALAEAAFEQLPSNITHKRKWNKVFLNRIEQGTLIETTQKILVSEKTPWKSNVQVTTKRQQVILGTLRGNLPPVKELLTDKAAISSVLWKRHSEVFDDAKTVLQLIFKDIFDQVNLNPSDKNNFHFEAIVGELLALYPYLYPVDGEKLQVPLLKDGKWNMVEYTIERINLTPKWMGSPLVAFGLKPTLAADYPPLWLFKGTTYPRDDGFSLSLLTDINPFASVGSYAFRFGRKKINKWLTENTKHHKAQVFGKSLGGALSWRTGIYFADKVEKVFCYGPPGLLGRDLRRLNQNIKDGIHPEFKFFLQKNDPVPYTDKFAKDGVEYYQVLGKTVRKGVPAHADICLTHERSAIVKLNPSKEAKRLRRRGMTIFRQGAALVLFPALVALHALTTAAKYSAKKIASTLKPKLKPATAASQ